jgi:hypothetical protein
MDGRRVLAPALPPVGTVVPSADLRAVTPTRSSPSPASTNPIRLRRYPDLSECVEDGPPDAPCQHAECRYHLAHRGYWEHATRPTRDCAIDVANAGPHTLDEVAVFLGLSGERVRQIEEQALGLLKHNATMKGLHDESPQ